MSGEKEFIGLRAQLDQYGEMMADIATLMARYHRELVARGAPSEVALALTLDFAHLWWIKGLWPDKPPIDN